MSTPDKDGVRCASAPAFDVEDVERRLRLRRGAYNEEWRRHGYDRDCAAAEADLAAACAEVRRLRALVARLRGETT